MFEWITCNVRDQSQVSETITSIGDKGGLDLLVNCANSELPLDGANRRISR